MSEHEDCACCRGLQRLTPAEVQNAPGLQALSRRVGTQPQFLASMHAALVDHPALARLATGAGDDPSLALLDAWAVALDVLAFYDERLFNEGFLGTAQERRSLLELARAIGYELRPGVAASTLLAFTVEEAQGAPERVRLDAGLKVQSVPGQDERPQVFETAEPLEARRDWNALAARATESALPHINMPRLWVKGTTTRLRPGDALLVVGRERKDGRGNENWDFRFVTQVEPHPPDSPSADPLAGYTVVTLDRNLGESRHYMEPAKDRPILHALRTRASAFGHNAPDWSMLAGLTRQSYQDHHGTTAQVMARRAAVLAHTAPQAAEAAGASLEGKWPGFWLTAEPFEPTRDDEVHMDLDAVHQEVLPGGWLVLAVPGYRELFEVRGVRELSRCEFAVSAKVTRVKLRGENWGRFDHRVREVTAYAASEPLLWAERPLERPLAGDRIPLERAVPELPAGRRLVVTGLEWNSGLPVREAATLAAVETDGAASVLRLSAELQHRYRPATVRVLANVVPATHGDTRAEERVGSGDGATPFQRFELRQKPLTYVPAANAMGGESSLQLRVDGVRWQERPTLLGAGPEERVYTTRRGDDGTISVQFGDGRTGARLPTGVENVRATYRVGTGLGGNVKPGALTTLLSRPLGLKEATNPFAAGGAQEPETRDEARRRAPLTVLALDRIVSLTDFEDFAAAFLGIGKAQATWLWDGERKLVHLTVAGAGGADFTPGGLLLANLRAAIDLSRSPEQSVKVDSFRRLTFDVHASVAVEPGREPEAVTKAVAAALRAAFSFEARSFAQGVSGSEVLAVMQRVPGVAWVDLDRLARHGGSGTAGVRNSGPNARVLAQPARWERRRVSPAELLLLDPAGLRLVGVTR